MILTMDDHCGKRKQRNPTIGTFQHMSVHDMRSKLKGVKNINKLNREELCKLLLKYGLPKSIEPGLNIGFIKYDGNNSCYLDTMVFALLHHYKAKHLKRILFSSELPHDTFESVQSIARDIRDTLKYLYHNIHGKKPYTVKCTRLRTLFRDFDKVYRSSYKSSFEKIEWTRSQQEPNDVSNMLMRVFRFDADVHMHTKSNTVDRKDKFFFNSPIIDIDILTSNRKVYMRNYVPKLTDMFTKDDGTQYEKNQTIVKAKFLQVNVPRNLLNEEKILTPVKPLEIIDLQTNALECVSILLHHGNSPKGGHYTCMFKHGKDIWYHYDDLATHFVKIGSFDDMLKWKKRYVTKNLVSCIYM